jgi:hypothetical protein
MKRSVLVAFSIIVLCGLLLLPTALVNAYYDDYETTNYQALTTPVTDGAWTSDTEWDDTAIPPNLPATFHWRQKWTMPSNILEHFLIEFFTDNTTDTGDYFQFCVDCNANGGNAPQTDDIRIDYVGHDVSGLTVYQGNGTGWEEFTDFTWPDEIHIQDSISSSPLDSNPHWIIELTMDRSKTEFDVSQSTPAYQPWIRVAVYDESNDTAGVQAWPPTSPDVPNDWGLETGVYASVPEPLTIAAVVLLSSVAVAISFYFLRKRPKTENHNSGKQEK